MHALALPRPTAESRQLLLIARLAYHGRHAGDTEDGLRLPGCASEVSALLTQADGEDVLSLTVRALDASSGFNRAWIEPFWRERVEERRTWSRFRLKLLLRLLRAMQGVGIRVAAIKGPLLSQALYGDPHLRDFHDLDIVVARDEVHRAARWLSDEGFTPPCHIDWFKRRLFLDSLREATFTSLQGTIEIDLHWRIDQPWNPPLAEVDDVLGTRGRWPLMLGDLKDECASSQPPATQLLVAAANVIGGWDCELRSLIDVARCASLLDDGEADLVLTRVRQRRSERCLAAILAAARAVVGTTEWAIERELRVGRTRLSARAHDRRVRFLVDSALHQTTASRSQMARVFAPHLLRAARYGLARLRPGMEDFQRGLPRGEPLTQTLVRSTRRKLLQTTRR